MDIEGLDIWDEVREGVVKAGPVKVLRGVFEVCNGVEDALRTFADGEDPAELLRALGEPMPKRGTAEDAAFERLLRLATKPERRSQEAKRQAEDVVLRFFDAWAAMGDNPGAVVAGEITRVLGREVASLEFDSGYPGSGQQLSAYRLRGSIIVVSDDYGVCGYYARLKDVLRDWLDEFGNARISCPTLNRHQIEALRRDGDDDRDDDPVTWRSAEPLRRLSVAEVAADAALSHQAAEANERRGDAHAAVSEHAAALNEWRLAASRGSSTASWKLAVLYCRGLGADRDTFEAARRCRAAAERGHPRARLRLARATERLLKYRDVDFWEKLARDAGSIDRRLESARARRLEGTKSQVLPVTIDRLSAAAKAGNRSDAITLVALLATNGRSAEAKAWWTILSADAKRLRIDDALVLELSNAVQHFQGDVDI